MEKQPEQSYDEYLLLIDPDQDTTKDIIEERDYFEEHCQGSYHVSTKPHITILNAITPADSDQSKRLVRVIDDISKQMKKFELWLNGYSTFKETNDLYINVMNKMRIRSFIKDFKTRISQEPTISLDNVNLVEEAHITLASRIEQDELDRLAKEYQYRPFEKEFWVKSLILLKRRVNISSSKVVRFSKFKEFRLV